MSLSDTMGLINWTKSVLLDIALSCRKLSQREQNKWPFGMQPDEYIPEPEPEPTPEPLDPEPEPEPPPPTGPVDEIDPSKITWVSMSNIGKWEIKDSLKVEFDSKFIWYQQDLTSILPPFPYQNTVLAGNCIVIIERNGEYYGSAYEWMRPNQRNKELKNLSDVSLFQAHAEFAWPVYPSEIVAHCVAGRCRDNMAGTTWRTNIVRARIGQDSQPAPTPDPEPPTNVSFDTFGWALVPEPKLTVYFDQKWAYKIVKVELTDEGKVVDVGIDAGLHKGHPSYIFSKPGKSYNLVGEWGKLKIYLTGGERWLRHLHPGYHFEAPGPRKF